MAKILEYRKIPLDDLVIGKGQVRTRSMGDCQDLAESIKVLGLLQPIVVCRSSNEEGKWEILAGQRRFLAHKILKKKNISSAVMDESVEEDQTKTISITENVVRKKILAVEQKDGIIYLYNKYGSVNDVVAKTGLPKGLIQDCVKYPRLIQQLKALVDSGDIDINTAVKAHDASCDENGKPNAEVAIKLAQEMEPMTGVQKKKFMAVRKEHPEKSVDESIELAKSGSKVVQIITTISQDTHSAIKKFAEKEGTNQDEATAGLIEEALKDRGFLES